MHPRHNGPAVAPKVTAVVLAYGAEPWLERSVAAVLASDGVDADVVLVDNGCTDGAVNRLESRTGVTVIRPGRNLGFAGGCNVGAAQATGDFIALVNGDAVVDPDALSMLVAALDDDTVGIATASIRLASDRSLLNSRGNDIHFLGFSWSGGFGQRAEPGRVPIAVTGASGAGMVMRRVLWEKLGGFDEEYFAYHEDAELSLRCWHTGMRVVYVSDAVVIHRYEFSRNPTKQFLLERNRLLLIATFFSGRLLLVLAPALVAAECGVLALAVAQGWGRQKLRGWWWMARHWRHVRARRRQLQGERVIADKELAALFVGELDPTNYPLPALARPVSVALSAYWALARNLL